MAPVALAAEPVDGDHVEVLAPLRAAQVLGVRTSLVRKLADAKVLPWEKTPLGRLFPVAAVRELVRLAWPPVLSGCAGAVPQK